MGVMTIFSLEWTIILVELLLSSLRATLEVNLHHTIYLPIACSLLIYRKSGAEFKHLLVHSQVFVNMQNMTGTCVCMP